jgi:DNA-directed RNA polymerase specialized sigma54-like protein
MLQMPILKLEQILRHELATNPLLEEVEEVEETSDDSAEESEFELAETKEEASQDDFDWDA